MKHKEGFFKCAGNSNIYYQRWLPVTKPKAVLVLVHGLAEHCGRYMNLVDFFVPRGYAVYGFDHLGHGKSDGARVYVKKFDDFIEMLDIYIRMIHKEQPGAPFFLVGHSMGGLIGAIYLLNYQKRLAGAILSGPVINMPVKITAFTRVIMRTLSILLPGCRLIPLEGESISRDPAVVRAYMDDPDVYKGNFTVRLCAEMLGAILRINKEASEITLPILIVQGTADTLVAPDGAQILYDKASSDDKTVKWYKGFYHEVFNEPGYLRVLSDVQKWLDARVSG